MNARTHQRQIFPLNLGGSVELLEEFLRADEADEMLSALEKEFVFEQRAIRLFGREVLQPRLISWGGSVTYSYSGDTLLPRPLGVVGTELLRRVNQERRPAFCAPFNHVLANLYRDGQDSMGMHADDEVELGPEPLIASLSLGAERRFRVRPRRKTPDKERLDLDLRHGSLLFMTPPMQRHYCHGLPKVLSAAGVRLNLTFRAILG